MNCFFIPIMFSAFWHSQSINNDTVVQRLIIPLDHNFKSIKIYNDILVYIAEGEKNEIIVKDEAVANVIKFKVDEGVLIIHCKNSIFSNKNPNRIIIKVKDIHAIAIMDDAEVRTIGELSDPKLKLEIFGDGAIYANTQATEVTTLIKGLGKIEVRGNFKNTCVNKDAYGNMITTYN